MLFENVDDIKNEYQKNLDFLHNMSIEENTLYHKFIDINLKKWKSNELLSVKNNIWYPNHLNDYLQLEPEIVHVTDQKLSNIWNILRHFTCSATWRGTVGRAIRFLVIDKITKKYLGVICLSSDFTSIGGRDKIIKWTEYQKMKLGMLKYTMNASCIVPTQPLGYNYLGGKLLALLTVSDKIQNIFNEKYKETLVGVTTTSLYGGYSQYNSLKYWKKCESSKGKIPLDFSTDIKNKMKISYKQLFPEDYKIESKKSHWSRVLPRRFSSKLNLVTYDNNMKRGVYWCPLYENSNEFLRMEDKELKNKKFDSSVLSLTELWKEKYAKKRINKIHDLTDILFYTDIINNRWDDVKEKYLKDLGR